MNNFTNYRSERNIKFKMESNSNFVSEPIGDKPVTSLPGIGKTLGKRLTDKGFDKVCVSYNMDFEF